MAVTDSRQAGYLAPTAVSTTDPTDALRRFVSELTGIPLTLVRKRWLPQGGTHPAMDADWCSVGIETVRSWATPESYRVRGDLEKPATGYDKKVTHQSLGVSVWFHGPNSHVYADTLREGAYLSQNNDALKAAGLTVQGVADEIRHLPDFINEQWVDRYEVNLTVGRAVVRTYGIRSLARVGDVIIKTDVHTDDF